MNSAGLTHGSGLRPCALLRSLPLRCSLSIGKVTRAGASGFGSANPEDALPLVVGLLELLHLSPCRPRPRSKSGVRSGLRPQRAFLSASASNLRANADARGRVGLLRSVSSLPLIDHRSTDLSTGALPLAHYQRSACVVPPLMGGRHRGAHSGGVGCPALSRSGVPPSPSRSTPLPLVAPPQGRGGFGR